MTISGYEKEPLSLWSSMRTGYLQQSANFDLSGQFVVKTVLISMLF